MTQPPAYLPPPRSNGLGIAAFIISLVAIFTAGILSPIALLLSLIALFRRPRGFAFAAFIISGLGTLILVVWLGVFGYVGFNCINFGRQAYATVVAPANATRDFIAALSRGDDAEAKKHSGLSDADYAAAKATIQAQGPFVDSTFNTISINEGDNSHGHVEGTAQFNSRTLRVRADLSNGPEGWRVTAIELLP